MKKLSVFALALLVVAGLAAPAFAQTTKSTILFVPGVAGIAQFPNMQLVGVEWGVKYLKDKKGVKVSKKIVPGFEFFTRENVDDPAIQQFIYK